MKRRGRKKNLKQPVNSAEDLRDPGLLSFHCVSACERVREREREKHGCHSNCVIMLVAIMKAKKTGKGRGLAQKLQHWARIREKCHLEQLCPVRTSRDKHLQNVEDE